MMDIHMIQVLILIAALHVPCNQLQYYVLPSDGNNQDCPTGESCYTLSYCLNDLRNQSEKTSTTTVIFILLPGVHYLNNTIVLEKYENVSFIGQGQWVQGPGSGIYQSTVIVRCTDHNDTITGLKIMNTEWVNIRRLTISGCRYGLVSNNINLDAQCISFQNNEKSGIYWIVQIPTFKAIVSNSSFYKNGLSLGSYTNNSHAQFISKSFRHTTVHILSSIFSSGVRLIVGLRIEQSDELIIDNCSFVDNIAAQQTIYIYKHLRESHISVTNSHFINNQLNSAWPATNKTVYGNMIIYIRPNSTVFIDKCLFNKNEGSGLDIISLPLSYPKNIFIHIANSTFENNIGSYGVAFRIYLLVWSKVKLSHIIVSDTKLHQKPDTRYKTYSAIYLKSLFHHSLTYISNVSVLNNEMTGMYVEGCRILFENISSIIANNTSPSNGGGMWLDAVAHVSSTHGDNKPYVIFTNNSAKIYGGALYSEAATFSQRPFLFPYSEWPCSFSNIYNASFSDNKAKYGNAIYGGCFVNCDRTTKGSTKYQYFIQCLHCKKLLKPQDHSIPQCYWPVFVNIAPNLLPKTVSSDPIAVCMCNSSTTDCLNRTFYREVYPGQIVTFWLVTVGMCGGIIPGVLVTEPDGLNISLHSSSQQTGDVCIGFEYEMKKVGSVNGSMVFFASSHQRIIFLQVNISFLPCPAGFRLVKGRCECALIMAETLSNQIQCNISSSLPVSRDGNTWLYYDHQHNCTVVHKNCPFDYCNPSTVYLSLDQPDLQCMYNRSGTLCGECKPGLSLMLGSNKCGYCENKYLSLVSAFGIAGVLLVAFLLVCNLTVSLGSINGLLFYANIVKLNENVFFPNDTKSPILSQFIDWLNLDLGIKTCFYNGLDGYWKTWLQFVFPLYVWLLILAIITVCHYFGKLSRLFGNNTVPVLATLILMSYTKLLRTITNVLMVAVIKCEEIKRNVWSVDGNVTFFGGKHIPLFAVALLFSVVGILYTLLVFSSQWLQRYSGRCCRSSYDPVIKLKPLIDAYAGPYKDRYRYWTGLLLIIRIIVTATFSYTSGTTPLVNNYIIIIITISLLVLGKAGVYRNALLSNLELSYTLNLALLCLLSNFYYQTRWKLTPFVSAALVSISFVVAVSTVCVHVFIGLFYNRLMKVFKALTEEREASRPLLQHERSDELYPGSPANVIQRRESLIFDFN